MLVALRDAAAGDSLAISFAADVLDTVGGALVGVVDGARDAMSGSSLQRFALGSLPLPFIAGPWEGWTVTGGREVLEVETTLSGLFLVARGWVEGAG